MNDKKNLSDYTKPRTDLNKLLPANSLEGAKILEGFNDNMFNRFLTKDQVERIVGLIGEEDIDRVDISQILEPTPYRQANQLQPIVYNKVGNVDWFMSFQDLMGRLSRLGVNVDRFNEWGSSLQFNWIPPVDLDKLINYQDYFWDSVEANDPPQYITIKNQNNWIEGRQTQVLRSVDISMPSYSIVGYDEPTNAVQILGDAEGQIRAGELLVLAGNSVTPTYGEAVSAIYDPFFEYTTVIFNVSEYNIDLTVNDIYQTLSKTEIPFITVELDARTIIVEGNVSDLFSKGFVFSSENSFSSLPITLWTVEASTYDIPVNQTRILVTDDIAAFDWSRITVKPLIRSVIAEYNTIVNYPYSQPQFTLFDETDMGDIVWLRNILLHSSTTDVGEGTRLGSSILTDTTGVNFLSGKFSINDTLRISGTGFDGSYPIENLVTPTKVGLPNTFFTQTEITYEITQERSLTDIEADTQIPGVANNQYWYDTTNDQLSQWNGSSWIVRLQNFSYLVDLNDSAHLIDYNQDNDWSDQNHWIHRSELNNFTGRSRAQHPILEYFPYVQLSTFAFADKQWRYRRNEDVSYTATTIEPTLFELSDIRVDVGGEVAFQDAETIVVDQIYGNLTEALTAGTIIRLGDFGVNTGEYLVASSEFVQLAPNARFRTRIFLEDAVGDPLDVPNGAYMGPQLTSLDDPWVTASTLHWQFQGIENISASSIEPIVNPMLEIFISALQTGSLASLLGLHYQEFKYDEGSPSVFGGTLDLHSSLHDMVLYEDVQEGDIRVYINGERQFGNFIDVQSLIDPEFVGGIVFNPDVEISDADVVRIEVGEYALSDVGKRAITLNTVSGLEKFNMVDHRRVEQVKNERSQYPWFNVYDINHEPFKFASNLFKYFDAPDGVYFPDIDQRIEFEEVSQDYTFEQGLVNDDTGELYLYWDGREYQDEFQSIWKRGINNEQYVPNMQDGFWEIPNQLYYNVKHENRTTIKQTEIFRHVNTILSEQNIPGIASDRFTNVYHLDNAVNYGLGGRIKEHNDGFDILISSMFVNNVNPIDLIAFANTQYEAAQLRLRGMLEENLVTYLITPDMDDVSTLTAFIVEEVKDLYEKNDRLDQWFGDSSTYDEATNTGVKNWIATAPFFKLASKRQPHIISENDNAFIQVIHHDGHRKDIALNPASISALFGIILNNTPSDTQTVTSDADAFPTLIDGQAAITGDLLVRTNTTSQTRKLYRYMASSTWEELNLSLLYAETILHIEVALFDFLGDELLPENFEPIYDFTISSGDVEYNGKIQEQYSKYINDNNIVVPYSNNAYQQNNAFTWNYAYSRIATDPITGGINATVFASWQALYDSVYGTPYPHLEPWTLQRYTTKPAWWDLEYLNPTVDRKWLNVMWTNILTGVIPTTHNAPNGSIGTGIPGQITTLFSYIPVNMDATLTDDNYSPDDLLPPYWNSNNSTNPAIRSLHDSSKQEFIITPSAGYEFGQLSPNEWQWSVSLDRVYDDSIVAFKLQPLKFLNQTFGPELIDVSCLQVDARVKKVVSQDDIIFHGDMAQDGVSTFTSNGLNQWYVHFNRFNGFDGISSEFRQLWTEWKSPMTYQFAAFIDTQNFTVDSEFFDIVNRDYEIIFKKSAGIRDIWLDAIKATLVSTPSQFADELEAGIGWTASFNNTSPSGRPIETFEVQNYPVRHALGSDTFKTFSFEIDAAELQDNIGFDIVQYSETLSPTIVTDLLDNGTVYYADVLFNGSTTINLEVEGRDAQTFGELVGEINTQLGAAGSAFIEDGNLLISSDTVGGVTAAVITDAGLFATANSNYQGTTGNNTSVITFERVFYLVDDVVKYFTETNTFQVVESTNFNGTYTIVSSTYDTNTALTRVEVEEDIALVNGIIDGYMEPSNALGLPDAWVTGIGISWGSNGTLPSPFDDSSLYYLIRISDREFQISETNAEAIAGTSIPVARVGRLQPYVGRIKNTFTAFSARQVLRYWKQHYVDSRVTRKLPTPITMSGIQNMIDFISGYGGYLESLGFEYKDIDGTNRDTSTGRENDWQLETEKLIEFLYSSRGRQQEVLEKFPVTPDAAANAFVSDDPIVWKTGTRVTLHSDGELPNEFNNPIASTIPYYVIHTNSNGVVQLAASRLQADKGIALPFSDNGTGNTVIQITPNVARFPTLEMNPHKQSILINHDTGVVSNIFEGSDLDLLTDQRVYDADNTNLLTSDVAVHRKDLRTQIELSGQRIAANAVSASPVDMAGMHIFMDGFEHVIQFQNYATSGVLLYDAFLGINSPRFSLEFDRQDTFTLRPNVGGSVIVDQTQIQNLESAMESLRFAYSPFRSKEGDAITTKVRDALGYDGPYDFADDLGITEKSQFIFYRGLIQRKGTNFAADAFANQLDYDSLDVDEFWAYRICNFGDSKEKIYPELKLLSSETKKKELRLEFVEPQGTVTNPSLFPAFTAVDITDDARWFNQPDQVEKLLPRDRFYINVKSLEQFEDVRNNPSFFFANGRQYLQLTMPADAAFVSYEFTAGPPSVFQELTEDNDYEFVTKTLIKFSGDVNPDTLSPRRLNVTTLSYNYDAQSPANIIDRKSGKVITEVPIWNPARGQYYSNAINGITYNRNTDPAIYNAVSVDGYTNYWDSRFMNKIWFDTLSQGYLPFDDKHIETDINVRLRNWGQLADWGEIQIYQWTESNVLPSEYDAAVIEQSSDESIPISERATGQTRMIPFVNTGTKLVPVWVEERDQHWDFVAETVLTATYTNDVAPLNTDVEVYLDGVYNQVTQFTSSSNFKVFADSIFALGSAVGIHVIERANSTPSALQITEVEYKLDTPYTSVSKVDPITGKSSESYYFWVANRLSSIPVRGGSSSTTTAKTIQEGMQSIPTPYMIPNNIIDVVATGFSDLFVTNNPRKEDYKSYEFPFVYNQLIIKGLGDNIPTDDTYTLRFTRDFSLRDRLANDDQGISEGQRKNIHWEWKLFREKQFAKIDKFLWDSVTESILGFDYDGTPLSAITTPLITATPTVTPTATPLNVTITPTPTQTGSLGSTPTPTPSVTVPTPTPTSTTQMTPTPSVTVPSVSLTPTVTPTLTPDVTYSPTATPVETAIPTITPTLSPVAEPPITPNVTPTPSPLPVKLTSKAGWTYVINATATSNFAGAFVPGTYAFQFKNNGGFSEGPYLDVERMNAYGIVTPDEWIIGNPSANVGDGYEVKATFVSSTLEAMTAENVMLQGDGVWFPLTDDVQFGFLHFSNSTVSIRFEIRSAVTKSVIQSAIFTVTFTTDQSYFIFDEDSVAWILI